MKWVIRIAIALIVIAGTGAVAVSYFFGSMRVQREAAAYLEALDNCAPFEQQAWAPLLRGSLSRSVAGSQEGACVVSMDVLGGGQIRCKLDEAGVALMREYVQEGAETVTFLGGQTASLRYSSENPDAMTRLLNGPDCALEQ